MNVPTAALLLTFATAALGQVPPKPLPGTPDPSRYPQLAAMKTWLDARSPEAQQCVQKGGLFLDADRLYRETKSEPTSVETIMQRSGDKFDPVQRDRLRVIVTQTVSLASALNTFDADTAAVAYTQMCMSRAQKPGAEPPPAMIRQQLERAQDCQRAHAANSLDRKECVASAFRLL
jgi:hypothetical protein